MKKLKLLLIFLLFSTIAVAQNASKNNWNGHVTLIKRSQLFVGAGLKIPNSTTKEGTNALNATNLNLGIYKPIWVWDKSMISLGINAEFGYSIGNGNYDLQNQYTVFNLNSQLQPPTTAERGSGSPRQAGFRTAAGPQMNIHLGNKFTLSPILNVGYMNISQKSFAVDQTIYPQGNSFTYALLAQNETKTSGLGILPKLRLSYNITPRFGIWVEGNYIIGPTIKTETTRFAPEPIPDANGAYSLGQFEAGTFTTTIKETSYSAVGVNGGIFLSLGKGGTTKGNNGIRIEVGAGVSKTNQEINVIEGEVLTSTLISENKENPNCSKITSPANGSKQSINQPLKISIQNSTKVEGETNIRIVKVSNDINYFSMKENLKELMQTNGSMYLSMDQNKSITFEPINLKGKAKGNSIENTIEKDKLTEGAYKIIVTNNCGNCVSNFVVSSGALTTVSLTSTCKEKFGDYSYVFVVKNTGANAVNVTSIPPFNTSSGGISAFTISTNLPIVIPAGGTQNFSGSYTFSGSYPSDVYANVSGHQVGNVNLISTDTEMSEIKPCICDFCEKTLEFDHNTTPRATLKNSSEYTLSIHQDWWAQNSMSQYPLVSAKAEIISFEREVSDDCMKCDKDWKQWGNFVSGKMNTTQGSFGMATGGNVTGNTHHSLYFIDPKSYSFDLDIAVPPINGLSCCCEKMRFNIRYTYTYKDKDGSCKSCSAVFEYYYQKGKCPKAPPIDVNGVINNGVKETIKQNN